MTYLGQKGAILQQGLSGYCQSTPAGIGPCCRCINSIIRLIVAIRITFLLFITTIFLGKSPRILVFNSIEIHAGSQGLIRLGDRSQREFTRKTYLGGILIVPADIAAVYVAPSCSIASTKSPAIVYILIVQTSGRLAK